MLLYYRMNVPEAGVGPDVFVVIGARGNHKRRSWFTWREDAAPAFVLEVASESTWRYDAMGKRAIYAEIGVTEYWRFDPTGECFSPALIGERLVDGAYQPIEVSEDKDGILRGHSDVLGLDLCALPNLDLRLYDPRTGRMAVRLQRRASSPSSRRATYPPTRGAAAGAKWRFSLMRGKLL